MSSSSSTSPPANLGGAASMKQKKLTFPSSKRTASASSTKKIAGKLAKGKTTLVSNADHGSTEVKEEPRRITITPRSSSGSHQSQVQQEPSNDKDQTLESRSELNIRDPRWRKLFADAKAKRNGQPLIHGKGQNEVHQILRVFDLNYDYGPCVGVTRLERWERAQALGLNPPSEIRDILLTREGMEQKSYSECVFYDEV